MSDNVLNVLNIETKLIPSIKINIYTVNKDEDISVVMSLGNTYSITYLSENGVITVEGKLKGFSAVPQSSVKYIKNKTADSDSYYIKLDCSSNNKSDTRKILIKTIRGISLLATTDDNESHDNEYDNNDNGFFYEDLENGDVGILRV